MELGTDSNNVHSQRASLELRAKFEGRLRNYGIRPEGKVRDAMLYSIIDSEWPEVNSKPLARLQTVQ